MLLGDNPKGASPVRVIDDRREYTSLSKAFGRFEGDEAGPGHWWGFCEIRLSDGKRSVWLRYFAGPMRPEPDAVAGKLGWP
jgi:hypothetical protein